MFKKKCDSCAKKVDKKFSYCPYCGFSFKKSKEEEDYGFLGREDEIETFPEIKGLPFGMNKLVNTLVKQLEKELSNLEKSDMSKMPKGIRINVSTGKPFIEQMNQSNTNQKKANLKRQNISPEEMKRRLSLPKINADSKVKRLSDKLIYEIDAPGVKKADEVTITKLATGLEVRAYSEDNCYVKFIPLTVELIRYNVKEEKVFVELKV